MRQNIKITKQDLKGDKFTTAMLLSKDFIIQNWVYFAGTAAVIVLIIAGVIFLQQEQGKKQVQASEVYNRALSQMHNESYQLAIVDFKAVIDDYGSTRFAELAAFDLGNSYFAAKNYTDAKAAFEGYLAKYEDDDKYFTTSAIAGIAASLAGTGDNAGAAENYRRAAEKYDNFDLAAQYYFKAMQFYAKSGNTESAKVMYAKLKNEFADSRYYRDSQRMAGEYHIDL